MAKASSADPGQLKKAAAEKPAKQAKAGKPARAEKPNIFDRLGAYFRGVRSEMTRVVWPSRDEVVNSSLVVVMTLVFFIVFTAIFDTIVVQVLKVVDSVPSPFQ